MSRQTGAGALLAPAIVPALPAAGAADLSAVAHHRARAADTGDWPIVSRVERNASQATRLARWTYVPVDLVITLAGTGLVARQQIRAQ